MPSQLRDPKTLADWLDLDYVKRPRRVGRGWRLLLLGTLVLSLFGVSAVVLGRRTALQAGPVSTAHASFNQDCGQCHVEAFRTFDRLRRLDSGVRAVPDSACTRCHSGPIHHATQVGDQACASCHKEHRGHAELARVADGHCTSCHADLRRNDGQKPAYDAPVRGFKAGLHPEFRLFAAGEPHDPGTVRFNHAVHLVEEGVWDLDRAQAVGGEVQRRRVRLECQSCHQTDAAGRYMQPIRYEKHCQSCHPLNVQLVGDWKEPRLCDLAADFARTPAPHPQPGGSADLVRGTLRDRLARFIRRAEADGFLKNSEPMADDGLLAPPRMSPLAREQFVWVNAQQPEVERLLFDGSGGCRYCHQEKTAPEARPDGLPEYRMANIPERWFAHAVFRHQSHQMLACTECHPAPASRSSTDVLLPRIDTCRKCHGSGDGQARSDCVECHSYHDHAGRAAFRGQMTIK
jgi:hypothetical protein